MIRSNVVFPEPEGPNSATSEPPSISKLTLSTARNVPNCLVRLRTVMLMAYGLLDVLRKETSTSRRPLAPDP